MFFGLATVDKVFFSILIGAVVLVLILFIVSKVVGVKKGQKPSDALTHKENKTIDEAIEEIVDDNEKEEALEEEKRNVEEPVVEEKVEEPVVEEKVEEPVVEEKVEESAVEEKVEEPVVEEKVEEPVVEEKVEEPVVEEKVEESAIEEKNAEPVKKGRTYNGKYEVFPEDKFYKYQLKASNGEILFVSELYTTHDGALKSIEAVRRNVETGTIRIIKDKRDMYKFKLVARNHRTLVIGANYTTEKAAISASESFKRFAVTAEPVDVDMVVAEVMDPTMTLIETPANIENKLNGKYTINQDSNNEYIWELRASNGEILVSTEGYTTRNGALAGIQNFKDNISTGKFYCSKDKRGTYQFKLYSKIGRVCALGESYDTKARVVSAVSSVLAFYSEATIAADDTIADGTAPKKSTAKKSDADTPKKTTAKKTTKAAPKKAPAKKSE